MVGPVRVDGLVSGIDFTTIIDQLLAVQRRPIATLQSRIKVETERKTALQQVNAQLLGLKGAADVLSRPSFFSRTKVGSSNDAVLGASGDQVSSLGAFTFSVRRLAQSHVVTSNGFSGDTTSLSSSAQQVRIEVGGGSLERRTPIGFLNNQAGIDRGSVKITDSQGKAAVINVEGVISIQDVLDAVNNQTQVSVNAFVQSNRIVLRDTGGGTGSFKVENYGADTTATDLGIAIGSVGSGVSVTGLTGKFIFGSKINSIAATTSLNLLNDTMGVRRNADGIADLVVARPDGTSFTVDLQANDVTVQDVVDAINNASGNSSTVTASLVSGGNALQITTTATGSSPFFVSGSGLSGTAAALDLGFGRLSGTAYVRVGAEDATTGLSSTSGNRIVANRLVPALNSTHRMLIRGGQNPFGSDSQNGVRDGSISITDKQGQSTTLNLNHRVYASVSTTVGAGSTYVSASSAAGFAVGNEIRITSGGSTRYRTITRISGTSLIFREPLDVAVSVGSAVVANNTSLSDLLNLINDRAVAAGVDVQAGFNPQTHGLRITDVSGGTGSLTVTAVGGTSTVADLGVSGTTAGTAITGGDLDVQFLSESTLLASLNGGKGVQPGQIRVFGTNSINFTVDLSQSSDNTFGRVVADINGAAQAAGSSVRARINDTGDGLMVTDTSGGSGALRVEEVGNTRTARDLNILGTAPSSSSNTIDGSFEFVVSINTNASLQNIATAINSRGIPVQAAVINDGAPLTPFKLILNSRNSGLAGRMVVDTTISGMSFNTTTGAQDSVLLYGTNSGTTDPIVLTSTGNVFSNVVPGLTLTLKGQSDTPVTITVTRDLDEIQKQAQRMVDGYNEAIKKIREFTFFNKDSFQKGILFTEGIVRAVQRDLATLANQLVAEITGNNPNSLAAVGMKLSREGGMTFDSGTFSSSLQSNFEGVRDLFTLQRKLSNSTRLTDLNNGLGIHQIAGNDFRIRGRNALTLVDVDAEGETTLGSLLLRINTASGNNGNIVASISPDGFSIQITDNTSISSRTVAIPTSTTTFVASESDLTGLADNRIVGATVTFTSGVNNGLVRTVSAFDSSTDTITLSSALPTAPSSGDTYTLQRELEGMNLSGGSTASDLRIAKKATLTSNALTGDLVNLKNDPGIGFRFGERLDFLTTSDGGISRRTKGIDDIIKGFNKDITRLNERIEREQERLIRQFSRLEQVIAESQSTSLRLQQSLSQVTSLARNSSRRS